MVQAAGKGKRLSYKFRMYPTAEQERYFEINFGCVRFVYNYFLDARIRSYQSSKKTLRDGSPNPSYDPAAKPLSFSDTSRMLTQLKKETVDESGHRWLYDADSAALKYALRHLDFAYQNFFRRVKQGKNPGFPKFKARQSEQSFTVATCKILDGHHVILPKIGAIRTKVKREVKGEIVSATIRRNAAGQYHISINVKEADITPLPKRDNAVGLAMGVKKWVATSDGEVFSQPKSIEKLECKLAREQRKLSRKQKGSANYQKQKLKVAKICNRISNVRLYAMHSLTRKLVNENGIIVTREMAGSSMVQQVNDNEQLPLKAKKRIDHALMSAGFAEINRQLAYKSDWAGRTFVLVPKDTPTAQVCFTCGYKNTDLSKTLKQEWQCPGCGTTHNRRYNGAKNVLEAGLDILAGCERAHVTKEAAKTRREREDEKANPPSNQ